jgi:CheY-specific phosphatase CheX
MQTTELEPLLISAASDVLESMCFVGILGSAAETPDEGWLSARLDFSGVYTGSFGIGASQNAGKLIASNFLGQETAEVSMEQIEEVLCELSNMICGSFLSRYRHADLFDLSHPACDPYGHISALAISQTLEIEEGFLRIWVELPS